MILRLVLNVLSNAIKYTPKGGTITIKAWREGEVNNISIKDTGYGLSLNDQEQIFERGSRIINEEVPSNSGLGMGLWISREITKAHGGMISVHSEGRGKGSEFIIELPVRSLERLSHDSESDPINH